MNIRSKLHHQQHALRALPDQIAKLKDKLGRLQADPAKAAKATNVQAKLTHLEHRLEVMPSRIETTKQQLRESEGPRIGYPRNDSFEAQAESRRLLYG